MNNIVWNWRDARFGAVITAIPFVVIITGYVEAGLPLSGKSLKLVADRRIQYPDWIPIFCHVVNPIWQTRNSCDPKVKIYNGYRA
jgi:hypothetical protein